MPAPTAISDWPARLLHTGAAQLRALSGMVEDADPAGTVSSRSRLLCAGLSELALASHEALGGGPETAAAAARTAALLSLVTKIDDQVIDGPAFHGGWRSDRAALRRRTRAYLAPTLASIRTGEAATGEPRCALAAALGQALLAPGVVRERREQLLEVVARGWEIQVEAVAVYTEHPGRADPGRVAEVTAEISGAWLLMIALCGPLHGDCRRGLTAAEERAFFDQGGPIQRADALADLGKDAADGLVATVPGLRLWQALGDDYLGQAADPDPAPLYAAAARHDADRACLPAEGELARAGRDLRGLGELSSLLDWIRRFLLARYLDHPACARRRDERPLADHAGPADAFSTLYRGAGSPLETAVRLLEGPCSAP